VLRPSVSQRSTSTLKARLRHRRLNRFSRSAEARPPFRTDHRRPRKFSSATRSLGRRPPGATQPRRMRNANDSQQHATAAAPSWRRAGPTTNVAVESICLVRTDAVLRRAWVAGGGPSEKRTGHRTPREPRAGRRSGVRPQPISRSHHFYAEAIVRTWF
jgi:hypothetical protein